jgi:hypothetical protein
MMAIRWATPSWTPASFGAPVHREVPIAASRRVFHRGIFAVTMGRDRNRPGGDHSLPQVGQQFSGDSSIVNQIA